MDDFLDLDNPDIQGSDELEVKIKYEEAAIAEVRGDQSDEALLESLQINNVKLRGDWTDGRHQELMAECNDGVNIRISRNNASDTFQVGAQAEGVRTLPELREVRPPNDLNGAQLLELFMTQHNFWRMYEQADCQQFAQAVLDRVRTHGEAAGDDDDGFM